MYLQINSDNLATVISYDAIVTLAKHHGLWEKEAFRIFLDQGRIADCFQWRDREKFGLAGKVFFIKIGQLFSSSQNVVVNPPTKEQVGHSGDSTVQKEQNVIDDYAGFEAGPDGSAG